MKRARPWAEICPTKDSEKAAAIYNEVSLAYPDPSYEADDDPRCSRSDSFSPFDIHLADGRIVTVLTPDHIMISPRNDEFAVYERDGSLRIIDGKLINSISRKARKRA